METLPIVLNAMNERTKQYWSYKSYRDAMDHLGLSYTSIYRSVHGKIIETRKGWRITRAVNDVPLYELYVPPVGEGRKRRRVEDVEAVESGPVFAIRESDEYMFPDMESAAKSVGSSVRDVRLAISRKSRLDGYALSTQPFHPVTLFPQRPTSKIVAIDEYGTRMYFDHVSDARRYFNCPESSVYEQLRGKRKTPINGLAFERVV